VKDWEWHQSRNPAGLESAKLKEDGLFGPSSASARGRAGEAYPGNTDTVTSPDLSMEEHIAQVPTPSLRNAKSKSVPSMEFTVSGQHTVRAQQRVALARCPVSACVTTPLPPTAVASAITLATLK